MACARVARTAATHVSEGVSRAVVRAVGFDDRGAPDRSFDAGNSAAERDPRPRLAPRHPEGARKRGWGSEPADTRDTGTPSTACSETASPASTRR